MSFLCDSRGRLLSAAWLPLLFAAPGFGAVVIVDNSDAAPAFTGNGLWMTNASPDAFGGTFAERGTVPGAPGYYWQWQPDLPAAGTYLVSVWYPAASDRPTNAVYNVYHVDAGGSPQVTNVTVDQTVNGARWLALGSFNLPAGLTADARVRLYNDSLPSGKNVAGDAVRFAPAVGLTVAVSSTEGGSTNPPAGFYTLGEGDVITLAAAPGVGYMFSRWQVSAGAPPDDPYALTTTLTMDVAKTLTAVFLAAGPANLTMATSAPTAEPGGVTTPDTGGTYERNEVVSIAAWPNYGYEFSHWTVSAGAPPADPYSASTTVTMDADKTVTAVFVRQGTEFRGMWVSRFGTPSEWVDRDLNTCKGNIDNVMQKLHDNSFNAVVFQMRGQADTLYPSPDEPWSPLLSDDGYAPTGWGTFDPMAYAINKAHEKGLEFHAYLNAHVCWNSAAPPTYAEHHDPQHLFYRHCDASNPAARDWLIHNSYGNPVQFPSEYVWIAPGVPDFQAYWRKQIMYVVTKYDGSDPQSQPAIDGVHFDRIRTPGPDYSHDPISEARRAGEGNPAGLSFGAWTADQITRTLCDLYAQIMEVRPQVKVSSSPLGLYSQDRYPGYPSGYSYGLTKCYQDAQGWLAAGAQDFIVPQIYWADLPTRPTTPHFSDVLPDWLAHRARRHVYAGQTVSNHAGADLVHEILVTRSFAPMYGAPPGNTVFSFSGFNNAGNWAYYSGYGGPYYQAAGTPLVPTPDMPWKTNPTVGIIIGNVTDATGQPIVDAHITRSGSTYTALSSGDGLYSFLLLPPGSYTITCTKPSFGTRQFVGVNVAAGQVRRVDISFAGDAPTVAEHPAAQTVCTGSGNVQFTVGATGEALSYQWQKNGVDLVDGGHYSGVTTSMLMIKPAEAFSDSYPGDEGSYRCIVSNGYGGVASNIAVLTLKVTTVTKQPEGRSACPGETVQLTVEAAGEGDLAYEWWKWDTKLKEGGHYSGVNTPTLTVSTVTANEEADYTCKVTGGCGETVSAAAFLEIKPPASVVQPPTSQTVDYGVVATFSVVAGGVDPFSYQWQKDGTDLTDNGDYSGATTDTLKVKNVGDGSVGTYRCVVTAGCGQATSTGATLGLTGQLWADLDDDGDVDLGDFLVFQKCFNGPNRPAKPGCGVDADGDDDLDVDLADFLLFQVSLNGPNRPGKHR